VITRPCRMTSWRRSGHRDPAAARHPGRTSHPRRGPRTALPARRPRQLARSLPGFAEISAAVLVAAMGRPGRFRDGSRFKSYVGLTPRASPTGQTERKGQPMSKAGPSQLRSAYVRAADTARHQDPQLARIFYLQMTERGATTSRPAASSPGTWPPRTAPSLLNRNRDWLTGRPLDR
jgi:Transposase IS116/IS110/IS902 family